MELYETCSERLRNSLIISASVRLTLFNTTSVGPTGDCVKRKGCGTCGYIKCCLRLFQLLNTDEDKLATILSSLTYSDSGSHGSTTLPSFEHLTSLFCFEL